ncbi:hypothetical protein DPQ22_02435 [Candidatus Tokpelaia sp.]|nr:hypothetical protein DPQ22_02435 [Candidatus Tokpelaia sp.]
MVLPFLACGGRAGQLRLFQPGLYLILAFVFARPLWFLVLSSVWLKLSNLKPGLPISGGRDRDFA